jgi:hypothetical protein
MDTHDEIEIAKEVMEMDRAARNIEAGGFGRIVQHMSKTACGFITAFRGENKDKPEINNKENKKLHADIRKSGLGYIAVIGNFIETPRTPEGEEIKDAPKTVAIEDTFCVINNKFSNNNFIQLMVALCRKYKQESTLITLPTPLHPEDKRDRAITIQGRLYNGSGKYDKDNVITRVTAQDITDYFTKIGGKTFSIVKEAAYVETKERDVYSVMGAVTAQNDFVRVYRAIFGKDFA